ncbi:MAG: InlB B-repeat-containing protein [Lachnospiraceae bacterium]|nr:InlB B-repeat-containing protein [Lachnospiraceae bacterium]
MKKKKRLLSLLLCGAMVFSLCPQVVSAEGVQNSEQEIGGLCEHHPAHDEACGYTEGTKGTPCSHEHTEGCYSLMTSCIHEHRLDCYPAESVSGNTATPSDADGAELTECTHVCSEESGCITKALDCQHEHDDACGYVPAIEGTPCGYVCATCNSQDSAPTSGQSVQKAEDELATSSDVAVLSVEAVQAMIDALPTADELTAMNAEEQQTVYADLYTAYDAYETLSDEQKAEIVGTEIFDELFEFFNGMTNTLADSGFTVEGGVSGTDYELSNDTLTIKTGKSLTISTTGTDAITGQIVIAQSVNADLKLDGVNIKGSQYSTGSSAKSAIELFSGSSLTLTLSQDSVNTLAGGAGGKDSGAPGIHVPQGAALTVLCAAAGDDSGHICGSSCAKLTIQGGSSLTALGGVGIGGGIPKDNLGSITGQPCGTVLLLGGGIEVTGGTGSGSDKARDIGGSDGIGAGGTGGTVIILTGVQTSSGSLDIGGGKGLSASADAGMGIKPSNGSNTYEVYGSLELPADLTIPAGVTVNIPSGTTLTVPSGKTLTNYGSITGEGTLTGDGAFTNHGTVNVTNNDFNNNTVAGAFNITGGTKDTDYTYADNVLTVNDGANLTISMADNTATTSDRIVIAESATATITLDGVEISTGATTSAIDLSASSNLTLILSAGSDNNLQINNWVSEETNAACIHVPTGTKLTIQCAGKDDNDHTCSESSCGKLSAKGNYTGAGIGGSQSESCGTVIIDGGIVTATGGISAAGIGGGDHGSGGDITINGGIVTAATAGIGAAGIGGAGSNGSGGKVTITGGIVTATGDGCAAGIGGGYMSAGGTVIITGGVVTATLVTSGGGNGAGIGGGQDAENGTFSTSDGSNTGNAVIFASSNLAGNEIGDDDDTSDWSGVIFRGTQGFVYGNVTLTDSFTIPSGYTLTIPDGATLTIPDGATITNNGTIDVVDSGKIEPESRVSGSGDICQFYTVTFDANGHGTAPKETLVLKNGYITQPTALTADGYTFGGWYKETECNTHWNFTADPVTGTMTLYAKWTRNSTGGDGSSDLTEGNTYWFDLSSAGIPGTVNADLPGGLSWVPFTYVGAVDAYVLNSSSNGVAESSEKAANATASSSDEDKTYGYKYSHSLFIADYNVTTSVSWDELNTANLIFGKTYSSGSVEYELRAPSVGSATTASGVTPQSNEWDVILNKKNDYIKKLSQETCWGQDSSMLDNQLYRTTRGWYAGNIMMSFSLPSDLRRYRPVLELPADSLSDLTTVTINLNGGSIGTTTGTVELIVKSGQNYSVPSGWELTPPDGKAFAGWKDSNGTLYSVIDSIPAAVTSLTALWLDKPIITKQPESATYYVGDTAAPLTVEASVTSGATLGYRWFSASKDDYSDFEEIQGTIDSTTYTPTTATAGTTYYFCLVLYIDGDVGSTTIYSDFAVVTVLERTGDSGTVTFDANGNGTAPEEPLVIKDGLITQPAAPTADGNAELSFTHASDYTIVIDKEPMDGSGEKNAETGTDMTEAGEAEAQDSVPAATATVESRKDIMDYLWIILLGVVVIVVGVGGYVYYFIGKKKDDEAE